MSYEECATEAPRDWGGLGTGRLWLGDPIPLAELDREQHEGEGGEQRERLRVKAAVNEQRDDDEERKQRETEARHAHQRVDRRWLEKRHKQSGPDKGGLVERQL